MQCPSKIDGSMILIDRSTKAVWLRRQLEAIELKYESQLNENSFDELLKKYRDRDVQTQRSNGGTHKDDMVSLLNGYRCRLPWWQQGKQQETRERWNPNRGRACRHTAIWAGSAGR